MKTNLIYHMAFAFHNNILDKFQVEMTMEVAPIVILCPSLR